MASKSVSRSVYQKKAQEAKKLRWALKSIVMKKPGHEEVEAEYRAEFVADDRISNMLRDYARNHYQPKTNG